LGKKLDIIFYQQLANFSNTMQNGDMDTKENRLSGMYDTAVIS